ncbi:MAG TPA: hypothetical protein VKA06_05985, partial [Spirochaetia bacterium]|nr:hypothetical protein [Spirochaetia bacterium]
WAYDEFATPWEGGWRLHGSEGSLAWTQDRIEVRRGSSSRVMQTPSRSSDFTLAAALEEFTAALDERRSAETSLADNMQTVAMVYGAIRSAETGVPVSIPGMLGSGEAQP